MSQSPAAPAPQRTFLGHPLGLYVLFFTEMWERFSYYGMRALLMLYMTQYFRWTQQDASTVYKVYTTFVYITPVIGGFLADRYLGNRWAVVIGAVLMGIGHLLMAFETYEIFVAALIFLIVGNGMFKPNISTQVGRLYPANDARRDGAYTIFYMGINLGAFLAPLACGWLKDNTLGGYHSGFSIAAIGMFIGLATYLLGQPFIREIPAETTAAPAAGTPDKPAEKRPLTEAEADATPSVFGGLSESVPAILYGLALLFFVAAPAYYAYQYYVAPAAKRPNPAWAVWTFKPFFTAFILATAGGALAVIANVASQVRNAARDRILAILALGLFVIFFWGAFEQAGNVQNIWAENNTNRSLWLPMEPHEVYTDVVEDAEGVELTSWERLTRMFQRKPARPAEAGGDKPEKGFFEGFFNPISTESFQSINALAIFVIAPFFAAMWVFLDRKGLQPSIALKMFFGLFFVMLAMTVMIEAAKREDDVAVVKASAALPAGLATDADGRLGEKDEKSFTPLHAGRIVYKDGEMRINGVLPRTTRDEILVLTAPKEFKDAVGELKKKSVGLKKTESAAVTLKTVPEGFDWKLAGLKKSEVEWDAASKTLTARKEVTAREETGILAAASEPAFRKVLLDGFVRSGEARISGWWLFWSYILATLGELCLSPVGLSMVNKLAPRRFATLLMGVWMLTTAFGNYTAGAAGEVWGTIAPTAFFFWISVVLGSASLVLLVVVRVISKSMHGVK